MIIMMADYYYLEISKNNNQPYSNAHFLLIIIIIIRKLKRTRKRDHKLNELMIIGRYDDTNAGGFSLYRIRWSFLILFLFDTFSIWNKPFYTHTRSSHGVHIDFESSDSSNNNNNNWILATFKN